jgi:hypothetical protein
VLSIIKTIFRYKRCLRSKFVSSDASGEVGADDGTDSSHLSGALCLSRQSFHILCVFVVVGV